MRPIAAAALILLALAGGSSAVAQEEGGTLGATVFVDPLSATLRLRPESIQHTQGATARATIENAGPAPVTGVTVTLLIDTQGVEIDGGPTRTLTSIAGNSASEVSWRLCGTATGSYLAMAVVEGSDTAGHAFHTETAAVLLTVTARRGRGGTC